MTGAKEVEKGVEKQVNSKHDEMDQKINRNKENTHINY